MTLQEVQQIVDKNNAEVDTKFDAVREAHKKYVEAFPDDDEFIQLMDFCECALFEHSKNPYIYLHPHYDKYVNSTPECLAYIDAVVEVARLIAPYKDSLHDTIDDYTHLLDSNKKHFDGDVVITDPCYIRIDDDEQEDDKSFPLDFDKDFRRYPNDEYPDLKDVPRFSKEIFAYNNPVTVSANNRIGRKIMFSHMYDQDMESYLEAHRKWDADHYHGDAQWNGVETYFNRDTLYGDWGCTTYNADTKSPIGQFCADSGMVCACHLHDVARYNPAFESWALSKPWTTTIIRDFDGDIWYKVKAEEIEYDGEKYTDYSLQFYGSGVNKKTGEPINFVTSQTSL